MQAPLRLLVAETPHAAGEAILSRLARTSLDLDLHTAAGGRDAIGMLGAKRFDCALIDAELPDLDATTLLRDLRALGVETPVIMVVNGATRASPVELLEAGAADCIHRRELSAERLSCSLFNALRTGRAERQLAAAERTLSGKLLYDGLTHLPNRALFFDRLAQQLSVALRDGKPSSLLLLDLNGFNRVNQSFGHHVGDRLLELAAMRLRSTLRLSDSVARVGDDEFAVLLPTGATLSGAVTAATKLLDTMRQPFVIDGHEFGIGAAIGIALHPLHGREAETLLRCAEVAMRNAKRDSSGFAIYAHESEAGVTDQFSLAHDLRRAVEQDELALVFQPKIALKQGRACGVEALLRWNHAKQGTVFPDVFIPLAEQTGMIDALTNWVLDRALRQCRAWEDAGIALTMSVNLSALTLHNSEFPATVAALLAKWQVDPARLILEITETAIISDVMRATEILTRLHETGVRISIDDFGTGYTSLAYIRRLPVSELKVDKSFVMNMRQVGDDLVIVRTIIELAHNLGLQVVAEGVEDAETYTLLERLGCDTAQGYHMSRPAAPEALTEWLRSSAWAAVGETAL